MEHLSKWIIAVLTPWTVGKHGAMKMQFEFSNIGLLTLMKDLYNSNASEIKKEWFRSIQTILHRKQHSNKHRDAFTLWESKNAH